MNPIINWQKGTLEWRKWKHSTLKRKPNKESRPVTINTEKDKEEHLNRTQNPLEDEELAAIISTITGNIEDGAWINSKSTTATAIQAKINLKKETIPIEEQIPKEFHEFLDVFSEEKAARFPET